MESNQRQEQEQDAEITTPILDELSKTPYACSTLTRLSGGTANFVYRGELRQLLDSGTKTVILKHAEEFLAGWREFRLTADRCLIEEKILSALQTLPPSTIQPTKDDSGNGHTSPTVQIRTPRLYHFSASTHTQVQEDLTTAQDLKTYIITVGNEGATLSLAKTIGIALGRWLRKFHIWTEDVAQREIKTLMAQNKLMQDLKCSVNYDNLVKTVDRFPGILEDSRDVFQKVRDYAFSEVGTSEGANAGGIHGDFWTGNILLPRNLHQQSNTTATIFVTDWELTQCGPRALDLGQMIAELYMLKLYKGIDAGLWITQAFIEEYRSRSALSVDVAFRTAIHAGVHLVAWGSTVPGWGSPEQVEDVVRVGRDLVVKGWEKDRKWFEESDLGCLFVE